MDNLQRAKEFDEKRLKNIWLKLQNRVYSYGKVEVCESWKSYGKFKTDMLDEYVSHLKEHGEKDTTIDRIDNSGSYSKENCRWATFKVQNNNRSTNHLVTYKGRTQTVAEWSDECGIAYMTLYTRLFRDNWTKEEAFNPTRRRSDNCTHGHLFDEQNTYWYKDKYRYCKACGNKRQRDARKLQSLKQTKNEE